MYMAWRMENDSHTWQEQHDSGSPYTLIYDLERSKTDQLGGE